MTEVLEAVTTTAETETVIEVDVPVTPEPVDVAQVLAAMTVDTATALRMHPHRLRIESLERRIRQTELAIAERREEFDQWMTDLVPIAHEAANEAEWCPVFDNGMEALGLPRRIVRVDCGWRATVVVSGAPISIDSSEVLSAIRREEVGSEANDFEVEVDGTVTMSFAFDVSGTQEDVEDGACICHQIDNELIYGVSPGWLDAHREYWTIEETRCDHDGY